MEQTQIKAIIYARKSTESEDRQVLSIDSQINELKRFASENGISVMKVFNESKSAKSPGRPIFGKLMGEVVKLGTPSILCWKLDRLARNPVDGGALIWAIDEGNIESIITPQRTFSNTGNDKFWMQLEFGIAKKYVDDLSDNVKRGLRAKLDSGWYPGRAPVGYLNELSNHSIVKDPERFELVKRIWHLVLYENMSPSTIQVAASKEWGLRTRQTKRMGGGPISLSGVYSLLKNPFYCGYFNHRGEIRKGLHEPMITKAEFDRVQQKLHKTTNTRGKSYSFTFRGLITCGYCGAQITAEHKKNRQGHRYIYYRCTRRKSGVVCREQAIEERELERQIMTFLDTITISPRFMKWALATVRTLDAVERQSSEKALEALNRRHESISRELGELVNIKLRGLLNDEEFTLKRNQLYEERARLSELINDRRTYPDRSLQRCDEFFELAAYAKRRFTEGDAAEKRTIISRVGSDLRLMGKKLSIQARKPFDLVNRIAEKPALEMTRFAPGNLGQGKQRFEHSNAGYAGGRGLVQDVRTYFLTRGLPTKN